MNWYMTQNTRPATVLFWKDTDWSLRDVDIARLKNVSRERARQVRRNLNEREAEYKGRAFPLLEAKFAGMSDDHIESSTAEELAKELGICFSTVLNWAKNRGVNTRKIARILKGKCQFMDFRLPNKDLIKIWGVKNPAVNRRFLVINPQKWGKNTGVKAEGLEYLNAYRAQARMACSWEKKYGNGVIALAAEKLREEGAK